VGHTPLDHPGGQVSGPALHLGPGNAATPLAQGILVAAGLGDGIETIGQVPVAHPESSSPLTPAVLPRVRLRAGGLPRDLELAVGVGRLTEVRVDFEGPLEGLDCLPVPVEGAQGYARVIVDVRSGGTRRLQGLVKLAEGRLCIPLSQVNWPRAVFASPCRR